MPPKKNKSSRIQSEVMFQAPYGNVPGFILYGAVPFLFAGASFLFARAMWFNAGFKIRSLDISAGTVTTVIAPVIWGLCTLIVVLSIYRRLNPQRIVLTTDGLLLPNGRFSNEEVHIFWNDLTTSFYGSSIAFMEIRELTCVDRRHGTKVRIASMLFRSGEVFDEFADIVEDYTIEH